MHEITMKSFRILVSFFLAAVSFFRKPLILLGILLFFSAEMEAADIPPDCLETYEVDDCQCVGNTNPITVSITSDSIAIFKINCLADMDPPYCESPEGCYMFFWDFGDGQFACGLTNRVLMEITHTYKETGNFAPRLIVTKRYTNSDPPTSSCESANLQQVWEPMDLGIINIQRVSGGKHEPGDLGEKCIEITPIHSAYAGEDVWAVVSFMRDDNQDQEIFFTYDSGIFCFVSNDFYPPTSNPLNLSQPSSCNSNFFWSIPQGSLQDGLYNIFFRFNTDPNKANFSYTFSSSILPGGNGCSIIDALSSGSVGPKDPNEKNVDVTYTKNIGPEDLEYTIFFYNKGEGPADSVTITDTISPMLDLCHFKMKSVRINNTTLPVSLWNNSYFCPDIDPNTRIVTWAWSFDKISQAAGLHGLYELGHGYRSSQLGINNNMSHRQVALTDLSTSIEIKFNIKTNCTFNFGDVIENEAEIQFDNLERLTTDPAGTVKVCCDTANNTTRPAGIPFQLSSLDPSIPTNMVLDSGSVVFDSGLPTDTIIGNAQYYIYPSSFDSLDRVIFRVCDDSIPKLCKTLEIFICIYDTASPPSECLNYPCQDVPCPIIKPWWPTSWFSWPVIFAILFGLFLLLLAIRRIFRRL